MIKFKKLHPEIVLTLLSIILIISRLSGQVQDGEPGDVRIDLPEIVNTQKYNTPGLSGQYGATNKIITGTKTKLKLSRNFSVSGKTPVFIQDEEEDMDGLIPVLLAIQPGLYLANKASANYYNGTAKDLNGIPVIDHYFTNPNTRREILDVLGITDTQLDGGYLDFNYNMTYDLGFLIGFQGYFGVAKRMWIVLDVNFVQLNTASVITLNLQDPNLPNNNVIKMPVYGQEQRFIVDLGAHWILGQHNLKFYLEVGGSFLAAKVKNNKFDVPYPDGTVGLTYSLMPTTNNTAANTIASYKFGGFLGGGLFYHVNQKFAIEAGLQIQYNEVELPGYNGYFPSYLIALRFIYMSN